MCARRSVGYLSASFRDLRRRDQSIKVNSAPTRAGQPERQTFRVVQMRIGVNALFQAHGGSLANLTQLLSEWSRTQALEQDELVVFASAGSARRLHDVIPAGCEVVIVDSADRGGMRRIGAEQFTLPRLLTRLRIDVLFCPANTVPLTTSIPCVTTFQNAAPFCEIGDAGIGLRLRWAILGLFMRMSARRSRRVIFLSRYFLDLFVDRFGFDAARGVVIYRTGPGPVVDAPHVPHRHEILSVAHFYPYKNLLELIDGFISARRSRGNDWTLVLAGGEYVGDYGQRIRARLEELDASESEVRLLGDVQPSGVTELLSRCEIFAFSSVCENCPTALVEALRVGVPIACSTVGVMPEIAGDAAEYFDPYSRADIERALGTLMDDPDRRSRLRIASAARGKTFPSPAEAARMTLATIRDSVR